MQLQPQDIQNRFSIERVESQTQPQVNFVTAFDQNHIGEVTLLLHSTPRQSQVVWNQFYPLGKLGDAHRLGLRGHRIGTLAHALALMEVAEGVRRDTKVKVMSAEPGFRAVLRDANIVECIDTQGDGLPLLTCVERSIDACERAAFGTAELRKRFFNLIT